MCPRYCDDLSHRFLVPGARNLPRAMSPFPFHRLPFELLITIFEYVEPPRPPPCPGASSTSPPLMILTHVCRLWRHLAIDTPTLWVNIRIHLPGKQRIACLYLKRSKSCPLNFTLISDYKGGSYFGSNLICLLLPYVRRWRRLTVICKGRFVTDQCLSLINELSPPHLEVLEIALCHGFFPNFPELHVCPILTGGAPKLRVFRLWGIALVAQPTFNGLTSFTLVVRDFPITLYKLTEILSHVSSSLEYLRLEFCFGVKCLMRRSPVIEMSALRCLDLTCCPILPYISTPKLEKLALQSIGEEMSGAFMNSTTYPSLRMVTLVDISLLYLSQNPHFVTAHPNITSLAFISCYHEDKLLGLLQPPKAESQSRDSSVKEELVLPNLRTLAIYDVANWMLVQSILADRIANGCRTVSRICGRATDCISSHLETWLGAQNIVFQRMGDMPPHPKFDCGEGELEWLQEASMIEAAMHGEYDDDSGKRYCLQVRMLTDASCFIL